MTFAPNQARRLPRPANFPKLRCVLATMTAYIANHEKKNHLFAKRERELLHAIKHALTEERLFVAAEKLRAAKIGVFKCRFTKNTENQPQNFSPEEVAAHNDELQLWLATSADEIVKMYRRTASSA